MKLIPEDIRPVYPEEVPAEKVRDKLLELLGLEPLPSSVQVEKGPAVESDDGLMEMPLTFQNGLGETVPGILLFPAESLAGTMGGIVCVSGTGGSAERVTHPRFHRPDPEGPALFGWGRELNERCGYYVIFGYFVTGINFVLKGEKIHGEMNAFQLMSGDIEITWCS